MLEETLIRGNLVNELRMILDGKVLIFTCGLIEADTGWTNLFVLMINAFLERKKNKT